MFQIVRMANSFAARLGAHGDAPLGEKSDRSSSIADGMEDIDVVSSVLVVLDMNSKELSMIALMWALSHVVQPGDTVRLLGILHHIDNPMGYTSRADLKSFNGANLKVLDQQVAIEVAKLKSVPHIYTSVEKLGAKLDIYVRANSHPKSVVVEEAKRFGARYVVIDRHFKKDKKFYIENLTCYVTRVKSMTVYEHFRHGVPMVDIEHTGTKQTGDTSRGKTSKVASALSSQEISTATNPESMPALHHQPQAPSSASNSVPCLHPSRARSNMNPSYEGSWAGGEEYGPEPMGYNNHDEYMDAQTKLVRQRAVQMWLDPGLQHPAPEYGYMTTGYSAEAGIHQAPVSMGPNTEATLADRMSNLYNPNPYGPLPRWSLRNESAELAYPGLYNRTRESFVSRGSNQSVQNNEEGAKALLSRFQGGNNNQLDIQGDVGLRRGSRGSTRAPVSVQPRRAEPAWAKDLFNSDLNRGIQQMQQSAEVAPVPERQDEAYLNISPAVHASQEVGAGDAHGSVDRISSVRRAVSSKKSVQGTPPLCTVCQQKSPVFGKVKRFTYAELQDSTNNFCKENYLANGGYGNVYRGMLKEGQLVAVKQHKLSSFQGDEEFCAEVEVLSCAQHRNLVTLIGYCVEKQKRLLVYEYVCNGSLDQHLSPNSKTDLQWHQRYKIALGAASALRYLHEECRVGCIVHRDMRPNNILLTHDFTPMVGDFGLARRQTSGDLAEETRVLGTIGYLAPEYAETGQITDKADVYAFGVVLLELITGRRAIENKVSLVEWARPLLSYHDKEMIDPRLRMQYNEDELHCMMHAAYRCIKKDPSKRPRMTQVLRLLNPPQEREWAYGPARLIPDLPSSSLAPHPTDPTYFVSRHMSSGSSTTSSCSQSDVSAGSRNKPPHPSELEAHSSTQTTNSGSNG